MDIRVDPDRGFVTARVSGPQTFESLQTAFHQLLEHPDFNYSLNRLWDVSGADLSALGTEDLRSLTAFAKTRPEDAESAKVAILVARDLDPQVAGLFKMMFEGFLPENIRAFHDAMVAEEWVTQASG